MRGTRFTTSIVPEHDRPRVGRVISELREAGLTYNAIAVVLDKYEGYELTPVQVGAWAHRLGFPKVERGYALTGSDGFYNGRERVAA